MSYKIQHIARVYLYKDNGENDHARLAREIRDYWLSSPAPAAAPHVDLVAQIRRQRAEVARLDVECQNVWNVRDREYQEVIACRIDADKELQRLRDELELGQGEHS